MSAKDRGGSVRALWRKIAAVSTTDSVLADRQESVARNVAEQQGISPIWVYPTSYSCHSERSEESTFADPSASPQDDTKATVSSGTHPRIVGGRRAVPLLSFIDPFILVVF